MKILIALLLITFLAACGNLAREAPTLIILNADIRTVDPNMPRAQAFAVTDGKFSAMGTSAEISALASTSTEIVDAGGVTIIPGLIDGHTHMISGASLATGVDLTDIEDKDEWLRIIQAKAETLQEGAWILGGASTILAVILSGDPYSCGL